MHKITQRVTVTSAIGALFLVGLSGPADADVTSESGSHYCRSGETPSMKLRGHDGTLYTTPPGRGYDKDWGYKDEPTNVYDYNPTGSGGSWKGKVEGPSPRLNNNETYAYCTY